MEEPIRNADTGKNGDLPKWLTPAAFIVGIVNVFAILLLVVLIKYPSPEQFTIFRIVLSLGGAAFSMPLTGFITVKLALDSKLNIVAGGALAVFVVLFFCSPSIIPQPAFRVTSLEEKVDFRNWRPFNAANERTSPVLRDENYVIEATGNDGPNFEEMTGTTNLQTGLDIKLISDGASSQEDVHSQMAPRRTYTISYPRQSFGPEGKGKLHFQVTYWNVFVLDKPTSVGNPFTDVTKYFRYPVEHYTFKCLFRNGLTYKKVIRSLVHKGVTSSAEYHNNAHKTEFEDKLESLIPGDMVTFYFDLV